MIISEEEFREKVRGDDRRGQLEAVRDWLINELTVHRCDTCSASRLRTGDQAALVLRLTTILEELAALPNPSAEQSPLEEIRNRRNNVVEFRKPS